LTEKLNCSRKRALIFTALLIPKIKFLQEKMKSENDEFKKRWLQGYFNLHVDALLDLGLIIGEDVPDWLVKRLEEIVEN
jgi:hypothetical protein